MTTPFTAGQRWTYRARPGEETSTALVLHCHDTAQGWMVNVRLDELNMPNPASPDGVSRVIGHLPIRAEKFRESVLELVETVTPVPVEEGYAQWRDAFDKGEAGVFDLTLAEIVEGMAQALAQVPLPNLFSKSSFNL